MVRGSDGKQKDTLRNVQETGEFVVNIVSEDFVEKMNICSAEFPPEVDEWEESGLTPVASECVSPARVSESRFQMECKLVDVVSVSKQPLGGSLVLGEVLRFHVADELFDNYRIAPEKLRAVGRMGGPSYARTTDRFDLERPKL
jgi:flavin reductase (DIM6/NTAB) family NADH-FMN oxidoreductase RutF